MDVTFEDEKNTAGKKGEKYVWYGWHRQRIVTKSSSNAWSAEISNRATSKVGNQSKNSQYALENYPKSLCSNS